MSFFNFRQSFGLTCALCRKSKPVNNTLKFNQKRNLTNIQSVNTSRRPRRLLASSSLDRNVDVESLDSLTGSTRCSTLSNGLRVVTEDLGGLSACMGLWIDAGSRYETARNNGVAHYLEHLIFKGTKNRSQYDLELEVENMGTQLHAYTSREQTVYYGKCQSKDTRHLLQILADILTNSVLDKNSIERERHVILREMQEVESQLQEVVFDHVHEHAFKNSPLAYTILGPVENIQSINKSMLVDYISTHYTAPRICLVAVGGVKHDQVLHWAEKYLGGIRSESPLSWTLQPYNYQSASFGKEIPGLDIAHVVFTVEGVGWANPDIIPLMIGNMMVGAWDRGSSNQSANFISPHNQLAAAALNETLCYSYQSFNTCYLDTGLWGVHFVSSEDKVNPMIEKIACEWARVANSASDEEVQRAKRSLKTNLMLQMDGYQQICEEVGRQMLCYGRRVPLSEMHHRIDLVTPEQVRKVIAHYALSGQVKPVVVGVGPVRDMMSEHDAKKLIEQRA